MVVALLFACASAPPECQGDYTTQPDGTCVRETTTPWEGSASLRDVVAGLDSCVPGSPSDRLDLDAHCADEICVGMTTAEITASLGSEPTCTFADDWLEAAFGTTTLACAWSNGVGAWIADDDGDGAPNPDDAVTSLQIRRPWSGTSPDGLGVGSQFACFVDSLGEPDTIELTAEGDALRVSYLGWSSAGIGAVWDSARGAWDGTANVLDVYSP